MNTTGHYAVPRDSTETYRSLMAVHDAMKASDCSYRSQPVEADQLSQDKSDTEI